MTIETAPKAASAPKAGPNADSRAAKAKSEDAGAGAGFMAILSSVDDVVADPLADAAPADAADAGKDPLAATPVDPALLLAQNPQIPAVPAGQEAALAAQNAQGPDAKTLHAAKAESGLAADAALLGGAEAKTKGLQRAPGLARADKADKGAAAAEAPATASVQSNERPQHDFKLFAAMEAQRNLQSPKEPELVLAALGSRQEKESGERSLFTKSESATTYDGATTTGFSATDNIGSPVTDVAPVLETQAAEQVKYWMSQDVQNAELKLDGLGDKPVEVSISMSGNEAHVTFRTDEQQTRGILEGAGAQLKDMLQREGVVLTGVSVGTSGANDGRGNPSRQRPGAKIAQVTAAQAKPVDLPRRTFGTAGRSVDLFV